MKRLLILLCFSTLFLFTGCELLTILFDDSGSSGFKTINIETDPTSTIYLVKLNNSSEIIKAQQTGFARMADVSEQNDTDTDSFIRSLNRNLNKGLEAEILSDSNRSAGSERAVTTGYTNLSFSKGSTKKFYSYTRTEKKADGSEVNISEQINAVCKYAGTYCYVFADTSLPNLTSTGIYLSDTDYKVLGEKFDSCYEREISVNGDPFYKKYNYTYFGPCNDKIIILVSDLFGDASNEQTSGTVGYFYQGDVFNKTYLLNNYGLNSNECEMFYIDALFLTKRPDTVYSTLVHEFNHMINYVIKTVNYMTTNPYAKSFQLCDEWFTEMLSMTTEDMFQSYLKIKDEDSPKGRLPYFNMYYNYGFKLWDNSSIPNEIMYANTYAFGAFLVRNFGGISLLEEMAKNEYVNETAITKALQKCNPNFIYKDEATNKNKRIDFEYALRKFSLCLFNTDAPTAEQAAKTGDDQYYSFNKSTDKNRSDSLIFTAIEIMNIVCDYKNDDGTIERKKIQPVFYKKDDAVNLGPTGFSVHYVGKGLDSFELYASKSNKIEYYLITRK